ncbi:GGDEF domain-containing protein, partial [Aliivibrio sifiae]
MLLGVALVCAISYVLKSYNKQSRVIEDELRFNANFVSIWLQTAFYHSNSVLDQLSEDLTDNGFV